MAEGQGARTEDARAKISLSEQKMSLLEQKIPLDTRSGDEKNRQGKHGPQIANLCLYNLLIPFSRTGSSHFQVLFTSAGSGVGMYCE